MTIAIHWQKSTFSGGNGADCVEIGRCEGVVALRESDDAGVTLSGTRAAFAALFREVRAGRLDSVSR
jgi:hypothetical protein